MAIKVLEEALGIESLSLYYLFEAVDDMFDNLLVNFSCLLTTIHTVSSSIIQYSFNILFKSFLSENFVNAVTEFSPLDVFSLLGCTESVHK